MPPRRKSKAAVAPVVEVDEFEEVDDELEEVDDDLEELDDAADDEEEAAPAPKRKTRVNKAAVAAATNDKSGFDSNWLADHVNENVDGSNLTSRDVRMLLRKMAREGEFGRDVGTDRTRYDFPKGANDPIVKKVVSRVRKGEVQAEKKAAVAKIRESAAKKAAATPAKKGAPKAEATAPARRRRKVAAE